METVELTQRQSARMAELPEHYRVVGAERKAPLVRKPTGQIIRIQQDARPTRSVLADQMSARHRLNGGRTDDLEGDALWHESS